MRRVTIVLMIAAVVPCLAAADMRFTQLDDDQFVLVHTKKTMFGGSGKKVEEARLAGDFVLWLRFSDGASGEVDLQNELEGEVFEPLRSIVLRYVPRGARHRDVAKRRGLRAGVSP